MPLDLTPLPLESNGAATFDSLTLTGDLAVGDDAAVTGDLTVGATLGVTGTTTLTGAATASSDLHVGDDLTVTDDVTVGGDVKAVRIMDPRDIRYYGALPDGSDCSAAILAAAQACSAVFIPNDGVYTYSATGGIPIFNGLQFYGEGTFGNSGASSADGSSKLLVTSSPTYLFYNLDTSNDIQHVGWSDLTIRVTGSPTFVWNLTNPVGVKMRSVRAEATGNNTGIFRSMRRASARSTWVLDFTDVAFVVPTTSIMRPFDTDMSDGSIKGANLSGGFGNVSRGTGFMKMDAVRMDNAIGSVTATGTAATGSAVISDLSSSITAQLAAGNYFNSSYFPALTKISAVGANSVTATANAVSAASATVDLTFAPCVMTGTTTTGSVSVTGLRTSQQLTVGDAVVGSCLSAGTTVATINTNGTAITLSASAASSGSFSLNFSPIPAGLTISNETPSRAQHVISDCQIEGNGSVGILMHGDAFNPWTGALPSEDDCQPNIIGNTFRNPDAYDIYFKKSSGSLVGGLVDGNVHTAQNVYPIKIDSAWTRVKIGDAQTEKTSAYATAGYYEYGPPFSRQWYVLGSSGAATATTSSSEVTMHSFAIPQFAMGPNGEIRGRVTVSYTSAASAAKSVKARLSTISGTAFLTMDTTFQTQATGEFWIANRNSISSQHGGGKTILTTGVTGGTYATASVDTNNAERTLVITADSDGTDTITIESVLVEICPGN